MENIKRNNQNTPGDIESDRRKFIKHTAMFAAIAGLGLSVPAAPRQESEEAEVTPAEDLMREHGLLSRILLIYDNCKLHLQNNEKFDLAVLDNSAGIVRKFVEDYHEKLEEDYLFPRFEKAGQLTDLVKTLRQQHDAGRKITEKIMQFAKKQSLADVGENQKAVKLIEDFNRMYRPHKSREDTVLIPAIKKIIPAGEYNDLGDKFEDKEHKLFGEDGFESMVEKVAGIEKSLNIYELSSFTPAT